MACRLDGAKPLSERTNAIILIMWPLGIHFSEILIEIHVSPFNKILSKLWSAKCRPFCLGSNVLATTKMRAVCLILELYCTYCPAKQGYCDANILTSGHPCQYQFSFFLWCVFIHGIIIIHFPELYFMHWIWCKGTLRYEVCHYIFVSWTKVHNAFYIFPERLELIGVRWPTDWRATLKFHNGLK